MIFKSAYDPAVRQTDSDIWFVFYNHRLLVKPRSDGSVQLPVTADIENAQLNVDWRQYIGKLDRRACFAAEMTVDRQSVNGFAWHSLRSLFSVMDDGLLGVAGRAKQIANWHLTHQFCGQCGRSIRDKSDERAKICAHCDLVVYPRMSPAIIVAVLKDAKILLARAQRFPASFYSVLAGFVEPGETLEECLKREVREEVGIGVDNIHYFGSQPWPFPNSLMIGFTAEYADGDIKVDPKEIVDADWFTPANLPQIPPPQSIARRLIDWYLAKHASGTL
ncbi:MAG: NAD(+) diphosphatase [Desulfobacterales bacterium]|nr:NAD(+) diphosphatase [Desulfobacterales bacterium]